MILTGMILDVETTGLSPIQDEIIEIGFLLFRYDTDTDVFLETLEEHSFLREPLSLSARKNYEFAFRIHLIPFEDVKGKTFDDTKIKSAIHKADFIIAHNASFDRSFTAKMYPELHSKKWYCSARNIPWKKYGYQSAKLISLLHSHKLAAVQTHRALDDVKQLHQLLKSPNYEGTSYLNIALTERASAPKSKSIKCLLSGVKQKSADGMSPQAYLPHITQNETLLLKKEEQTDRFHVYTTGRNYLGFIGAAQSKKLAGYIKESFQLTAKVLEILLNEKGEHGCRIEISIEEQAKKKEHSFNR
ncbi:exonuclease domain-containing protein [Metabacillus hrfriensis]|uniref:Exonuclease domain-containing protein n=1 Tax=Metabacillus hrfriensis TaxID=3048891 RepID=A0ACD4R9E6_9BACI|nr:exonuclease domain-containing protein [Metabacillus sp. CT-WN-B3]WHZ57071.1 exonuclease domain-containing protein [Metabacillus sp. CT-WN-B3]